MYISDARGDAFRQLSEHRKRKEFYKWFSCVGIFYKCKLQ